MAKSLFIRGIDPEVSQELLKALFMEFGRVKDAIIIHDKETGESKGFGFVNYYDEGPAVKAMEHLNGYDLKGKRLIIEEARPPKPREEREDKEQGARSKYQR